MVALRERRRLQRIERNSKKPFVDRLQDEVEDQQDAFLLDPGMGPMTYITADGRVLFDDRSFDDRSFDGEALREATDDEAIAALVVGAKKTGINALLELIPVQPLHSLECPACTGGRWTSLPGYQRDAEFVCFLCRGRGWADQAMLDKAAALGTWPPRET
ncbi:MAG: hypothetical protein JWO36_1767 [Myxococcales bacterium]|nr:hypothetical protein [Myxococcales bacterium]